MKKEKNNKYIKYILSILLFALVIFLTFYTILYHNDINSIINNLRKIQINYILVCILLIFTYFLLQGIYMKRNLKILNYKISIIRGTFYSMLEFFFSGITPSSTGGQPVQLYYMNSDGIPTRKSLITLLINTIFFKLILIILGLLILIFNHSFIFSMPFMFILLFFIGLIVDLIVCILGFLALYNQKLLKTILKNTEKIVRLFKKDYEIKFQEKLDNYNKEVKLLKNNKGELFFELFITLIQRLCLFSISYAVYRSFGLNDISYLNVIIVQISVQLAIEFIPIPGGTGISEYLTNLLFLSIFGEVLAPTGMLVTRTFAFYIPLVLCGIFILINYIKDIIKNKL